MSKQEFQAVSEFEVDSDFIVFCEPCLLLLLKWSASEMNKLTSILLCSLGVKRRKSTNSFSEEEKHCSKKQRSNSYTGKHLCTI